MPQKNGMGRHTAPLDVPEAPVFYPTMEEFSDFTGYIEKIEATGAAKAGICKIIPPEEWVPRKIGYKIEDLDYTIEGPIKQQFMQVGGKGTYQTKGIVKPAMSVKDYYKMATNHQYCTPTHESYDDLERKYWKSLAFCPPIYGCDVASHLTDPDQKVWNIAKLGSVLDLIKEDDTVDVIPGVLSPYLYFGMWKATFSWHIEDMDLYAINMVHHGAPKTWYCVPPQYGHLLEKAARGIFPNVASWCSNFMRHKTCMIAPNVLDDWGVPYQKVVQEERNIIITFPYAYHCGFNHGFNIAESTNFAIPRWVEYGKRSRPCDCSRSRVSFKMDIFVKKYQPEKYDDWINHRDIAPHPEDPPEVAREIIMRAEDPASYKRMMEDRMRLETRRRPKKVDEAAEEQEEKAGTVFDIYQHHELANVRVEVNPLTMKCRGHGSLLLRNFFDEPVPDVEELIDQGVLIKIGSKTVEQKKRLRMDDDDEDDELVPVMIYKHLAHDIEAIVCPETLELVGEQSRKLLEFILQANVSIKKLIEMGIFTKYVAAKIRYKPEPDTSDLLVQPPSKKMKTESDEVKEEPTELRLVTLHKYKHELSGLVIKVVPKTQKPFYTLTQQAKYFLRGRTVKEVIEAGILTFDGEIEVEAKARLPAGTATAAIPQVKTEAANDKATKDKSARPYIPCDIYRTTDGSHLVNISCKTKKMIGRKPEEIKRIMGERSVEDLIESGELIFVGKRKVGEKTVEAPEIKLDPTDNKTSSDNKTTTDEVDASLSAEVNASLSAEAKATDLNVEVVVKVESEVQDPEPSNEDDEVQFIEEEDPDEVAKLPPAVKTEAVVQVVDYESDEDDEMLYTTESSSDSNESSDDPNYGSHGNREGLWSHRRSKTKKKKMKRLMKLKLISKQERYDMLMNRKNRPRTEKSERRQQRHARAVDTRTIADLTRSIVAHLTSRFEDVNAINEFNVQELKELYNEDRSNIVSIVKILIGLEVVSKNPEVEDKYYWQGVDHEELYGIFIQILNGGKLETENNIWLIFREFVREVLHTRKGGRVYPTVIGQRRFGVNETRRVTLSAAVLEGIGLVASKVDDLGGVVWCGKHIFDHWDADQVRLNSDVLEKRLVVNLEKVGGIFTAEQIEDAIADTKHFIDNFSAEVAVVSGTLDTEQQRTVANKDVMCRCGMSYDFKYDIKREGSSHVRRKVWTGFKKRIRCKKCPGCLAVKCNECKHCLKKHLKKPCVLKVCQFPVVPKCPCFS